MEVAVLAFSQQFHLKPWEVLDEMPGWVWEWWQEQLKQRQDKRGRPKN